MRLLRNGPSSRVIQSGATLASLVLGSGLIIMQCPLAAMFAQTPTPQPPQHPAHHRSHSSTAHRTAKSVSPPAAEPAPPMPKWPVNDSPSRASVTWDSHGLRIDASNSSMQQILSDVSTETGTKVEGLSGDQRVYGSYGPGQARDVISQLLAGSGYNVLLAGDLGSGAPRQVMLTPRRAGGGAPGSASAQQDNNSADDDIPDNEVEEQPPPQQPIPMQPANPGIGRPGFGPNGPIRTPQQVMEEMQRQQLLQQQQPGNQPNNNNQ